jgi:hypothetical protein
MLLNKAMEIEQTRGKVEAVNHLESVNIIAGEKAIVKGFPEV